jgi:Lambda phage tail tape-measure protein (Tape_meas_lam_C)
MARLTVTINAKGAKSGAAEFNGAIAAMTSATKEFEARMSKLTGAAAADFASIGKSSREASAALGSFADKAKGAGGGLSKNLATASAAASTLKASMLALAGSQVAGALVGTIASYEGLKSALITATKSASGAEAAFSDLRKFADVTPFTLEEATKAYIRMSSAGLKPTISALTDFGDIASAIPGKTILDFVEAVADGTQGQGRRLKEFGIDLNNQGSNVELVFGGMATVVKNDAASIEEGIRSIARANFGGSMERQSKTLAGQWSTLTDKAAGLAMEIGAGGLLDAMKDVVLGLTAASAGSASTAHQIGAVLGGAVKVVGGTLVFFIEHIKEVKAVLAGAAFYAAATAISAMGPAILFVAGQLVIATTAAGGFRVAMMGLMTSNPLGWVALGITALIELTARWGDITKAIDNWVPPKYLGAAQAATGAVESQLEGSAYLDRGLDVATMGMYSGYKNISFGVNAMEGLIAVLIEGKSAASEVAQEIKITAKQQEDFNLLVAKGAGYAKDFAAAYKEMQAASSKSLVESSADMNARLEAQDKKIKKQKEASALFASAVADKSWLKDTKSTGKSARQKEAEEYLKTIKELAKVNLEAQAAQDKLTAAKVDFFKNLDRDTRDQQALADALKNGNREYEFQAKLIAAVNQAEDQGITLNEAQIDLIKTKLNLQLDAAEAMKKLQEGTKIEEKEAKQKTPIEDMIDQYATLKGVTQEWQNLAMSGLNQFSSTLADAMTGGKVDWQEFAQQMKRDIVELLIKMLVMQAIKAALSGATGGASSALFGAASGLGGITGAAFHSGGTVGAGGTPRTLPAAAWSGAPRYHSGTLGLRPDERAAVLQTGEEVLSRSQVAQAKKGGKRGAEIHFHLPAVADPRGFMRGVDQYAGRMRRTLGVDADD